MMRLGLLAGVVSWLALGSWARADDPAHPGLGFASEQVALAARVDLGQDPEMWIHQVLREKSSSRGMTRVVQMASSFLTALKKAGARELVVLVDVTEMPGYPTVIVSLAKASDAAAVTRSLSFESPMHFPACETIRGFVVAGTQEAVHRLRTAPESKRTDLAEAFAAASKAQVSVAFAPSLVQRRAFEESMPSLPLQLGGGPVTTLTRDMKWAVLDFDGAGDSSIHGQVQATNEAAARKLAELMQSSLQALVKACEQSPNLAAAGKALRTVRPSTSANLVKIDLDVAGTTTLITGLISQAEAAAERNQCSNNLKQIALALHNYHSQHKAFPPAYTTDKNGKPLLSWRVLILPYLEEQALYEKFHLDEPWDSKHNKSLLANMPKVYACPSMDSEQTTAGKTSYLAPRGPRTIFSGGKGTALKDVTDGTSNTIVVIDVGDQATVAWTAPEDWPTEPNLDLKKIFGHHAGGTNMGFADGSVRFLQESINPAVILKLITKDGGEVIDQNEL